MHVIERYYPNWKNLRIHESSPVHRGASTKLRSNAKMYVPTHYFPNEELGKTIKGFRNENLEMMTFGNSSFDLMVTQDVMEHIYNPAIAFREIARILKPGGAHIFTVPLINRYKKTERWAKLGDDGNPVFLYEPEYHGNPIDPLGSAVTMHWGCDIVDFIHQESGLETTIEYIDDLSIGVRAEFREVMVSRKE